MELLDNIYRGGNHYGKDIDLRPQMASLRTEEGHWEGDTVVGKRAGKEAVVLSLLEKKMENYIAMLISGKTSEAVMAAMRILKAEFGDRFAQVFKTITVDNGSEFADFAQCESRGTRYSSLTPILRGNGRKMDATTGYSELSSLRAHPWKITQQSIFWQQRMS